MELVEGRPLSEHARGLALGARLELVARVADAVQHAHSQGVVHRDLKPGNVLVEADGTPKVLDFGIARASDADLQASTILTRGGELVGTLPYMSPEQLAGDPGAVDARSDVYALGVNLYLIVTGRLPLEIEKRSLTEALTLLRDQDPPALRKLDPRLAGDLETIVAKALAKEPARRYQTAAELALDLRRFLAHEPILARRAGPLYLLAKFARRNRALAAASVTAALLVLVGLIATFLLYRREKENAARNLSLTTLQRLAELREGAADLWPQHAFRRDDMVAWLASAETLVSELPVFERFLDDVRRRGRASADGGLEFPSEEERWLHDSLAKVVFEVRALGDSDPKRSLLAEVQKRLTLADAIAPQFFGGHEEEWEACLAAIERSPAYGGLALEPQAGFVPLRQDPRSGLWEFWHPASGKRPSLDAASDSWSIDVSTGIVFVLLPAGRFEMGAQDDDPSQPNYDVNRRADTGPIHEVRLSQAFFLARYELTRGQWQRLGGKLSDAPGERLDEPLVGLGWDEPFPVLVKHDLGLPSEAQWEYAARAGTTTTWFGGEGPDGFERCLNGRDRSYDLVHPIEGQALPPWDDGFVGLAPVGLFAPNPFGLHDILGNAEEWCFDHYGSYELPVGGSDAERLVPAAAPYYGERVIRGGSFRDNNAETTSSARRRAPSDRRSPSVGLRLHRMVRPMPITTVSQPR
jgi:formylglycine-generating enzyme required for sulfatase activity